MINDMDYVCCGGDKLKLFAYDTKWFSEIHTCNWLINVATIRPGLTIRGAPGAGYVGAPTPPHPDSINVRRGPRKLT
jgi:hypothetical protein